MFLEMEVAEDHDWRQESGLLVTTTSIIAPNSVTRIWGDKGFRLFLSHKAEVKKETAGLKEKLGRLRCICVRSPRRHQAVEGLANRDRKRSPQHGRFRRPNDG